MKSLKKIMAVAGACALVAGSAHAASVSTGIDFASAYIFRGATFNDGWVAQPSLEVGDFAEGCGLTLGVWGNYDIESSEAYGLSGSEFTEVDIYASYDIPVDLGPLGLSVGYTEYTYPGAELDADREVSLSASLDLPLAPSLGVYYGVDGGIEESLYVEAGVEHSVENVGMEGLGASVGAVVGYVEPDAGEGGFSHATFTAGLSYSLFSASVSYVAETDDDVLVVDEDILFVLGVSNTF